MVTKLDEVMKANPEWSTLDKKDVLKSVHQQYYSDMPFNTYKKRMLENPEIRPFSKTRGFARSLEETLPNVAKTMKSLIESPIKLAEWVAETEAPENEPIKKFVTSVGGKLEKYSDDYKPVIQLSEEEEQTLGVKVGRGLGSAVKYASGSLLGFGTPLMSIDIFGQSARAIEEEHPEWSEAKKLSYATVQATLEVILERGGTAQLVDPIINGLGKTTLKKALMGSSLYAGAKQGLKNMATESAQEASQQLASNIVDKFYGLDTELQEGILDSAVVGGLVGGIFGVSTGAMTQQSNKAKYNNSLKVAGFSNTDITALNKSITSVVDSQIENNPEGFQKALQMVVESDVFKEMPDTTRDLVAKLSDTGMTQDEIIKNLENSTIEDQTEMLEELTEYEKELDDKVFAQEIKDFTKQLVESGVSQKQAEHTATLHQSMVLRASQETGKKKSEITKSVVSGVEFKEKITTKKGKVVRGKFSPERMVITLSKAQDESTISHEMGHAYFEYNLKHQPEKLNTIMKDFGVTDYSKLSETKKDQVHEKFADSYLTYLAEGKAPTTKLQAIFDNFKSWLGKIYGDVKNMRIQLSDASRAFFDDMLKPVEQIAKERKEAKPPLTEEQKDKEFYQKIEEEEKKTKKAIEKLDPVTMKTIKEIQNDFEMAIKEMGLGDAQIAEFLPLIKEINTQAKLRKAIKDIKSTSKEYYVTRKTEALDARLKKELSTTGTIIESGIRKGRYDLETNRFFKKVNEIKGLTISKAKEELAKAGEPQNDQERFVVKMLNYKANRKSDLTPEFMNELLSDLKTIKKLGKTLKENQALIKNYSIKNKADKMQIGVNTRKATPEGIESKLINTATGMFGNTNSYFSALFGKDVADKNNLELVQNRKETAVYNKIKKSSNEAVKIFGLKNQREFVSKMNELVKKEFTLIDKENVSYKLSRQDLMTIYNTTKNENVMNNYNLFYGDIKPLLAELTQQETDFADYLMEELGDYYETDNIHHIRKHGTDLGRIKNYFPSKSKNTRELFDEYKAKSESASFQKQRTKVAKPDPEQPIWKIYQGRVNVSEHIKHISPVYEDAINAISQENVEKAVTDKFGKPMYNKLKERVELLSLNQEYKTMDTISGVVNKMLNNWVVAKIASPTVFVKQLISVANYSENIPYVAWNKNFFKGLAGGKKTYDYMMKEFPFLESRLKRGNTEAINRAIKEASVAGNIKNEWTTALTALTRTGDIGAIVYGGYGYVKYLQDQGFSKKQIQDKFESETLRAQQSGLSSSVSDLQNSKNVFNRFFMAFKNTPNQYARKQIDSFIKYRNGEIDGKQLAKTISMYTVIQPALFAFAGNIMANLLFGDDDSDLFEDIMIQLASSPLNAIPIIDDFAYAGARQLVTGKKPYKITSDPMLDDLEKAYRNLTKDDIKLKDVMDTLIIFGEIGTATPLRNVERIYKGNFDKK